MYMYMYRMTMALSMNMQALNKTTTHMTQTFVILGIEVGLYLGLLQYGQQTRLAVVLHRQVDASVALLIRDVGIAASLQQTRQYCFILRYQRQVKRRLASTKQGSVNRRLVDSE